MDTYYSILGVTQKATKAEIKSAYRALAVQYHPDRTPNANEAVRKLIADKMAEVNEAYTILSKDSKRAQYDALIAQQFPQAQPAVSQAQCSRCGNTIYPPTQIFGVCDACAGAQQAAQPGTQAQWGPSAIPTAGAKKIGANKTAWIIIGVVVWIGWVVSQLSDPHNNKPSTPTVVAAAPTPKSVAPVKSSTVPAAPVKSVAPIFYVCDDADGHDFPLSTPVQNNGSAYNKARADSICNGDTAERENKKEAKLAKSLPREWIHDCTKEEGCSPSAARHSSEIWIENGHLYEAEQIVTGTLKREMSCTTVPAVSPAEGFAGTCTYKLSWYASAEAVTTAQPQVTCSITTSEVVSYVDSTRIEGVSGRVDYSPLKTTPPTCPIAGTDKHKFFMTPVTSAVLKQAKKTSRWATVATTYGAEIYERCFFNIGSSPCGYDGGRWGKVASLHKGEQVQILSAKTRSSDGHEIYEVKFQSWVGWVDATDLSLDEDKQ